MPQQQKPHSGSSPSVAVFLVLSMNNMFMTLRWPFTLCYWHLVKCSH